MAAVHEVTDPKLAKALTGEVGAEYLAPFFAAEHSVKEAAEYLGRPLGKVHHWVKRWLELGALRETRRLERAGRPIRLYRTTADEFVVPENLLPESLLERQLTDLNREFLRGVYATVPDLQFRGTVRIYLPEGKRHVTLDRSVSRHTHRRLPAYQSSMRLLLTDDEARELRDEMMALHDRWLDRAGGMDRGPDDPARREHLIVLGVTRSARPG